MFYVVLETIKWHFCKIRNNFGKIKNQPLFWLKPQNLFLQIKGLNNLYNTAGLSVTSISIDYLWLKTVEFLKGVWGLIFFFGKHLKYWFLFFGEEFLKIFHYCYETEIKGYCLQPDYRFHHNNLFIVKVWWINDCLFIKVWAYYFGVVINNKV